MKLDLDTIESRIDKYHEGRAEKPRSHLGVSTIGEVCERKMWYSFHWSKIENFSGRMLRLFRRGQMEEDTVIKDLASVGIVVDGRQNHVRFGSHVSGSTDGIIKSGIPEAPDKEHVLEIKTHSKKSFDELEKKGVKVAKFEHWAQMQGYMLGLDIDRALYYAVCKDDDRIYTERVRLEKTEAKALIDRAKRIAIDPRLPPPNATFHCNWCSFKEMCQNGDYTREKNCRTCSHSTAKEDGTWFCERHNGEIPLENQYRGCKSHVFHPDLIPFKMIDGDGISATFETIGKNGDGGRTTEDILKDLEKQSLNC